MKKHFKKLLAVVLTLTMVLAMGITAFADDQTSSDGSITVRNATVGKEYAAYKVFDLTYVDPTTYDADGQATTPVSYTYTDKGTGTASDAFLAALTKADADLAEGEIASPFTLTEVKDGTTPTKYNVTLKEGKDAADVTAFLKANASLLGDPAKTPVTASTDTVKFEGLPYGYYFVTSALGSEVTIDSTLKDVTIVDKNEEPTTPEEEEEDDDYNPEDPTDPEHPSPYTVYPGKQIVLADGTLTDVNSANYGDYVHFGYSLNATAYADPFDEYNEDDADDNDEQNKTGLVTYYYIDDVMGQGFDLAIDDDDHPFVVRVIKADGTIVVLDEEDGDYSIRYSENAGEKDTAEEAFQITIPWGEKYGSNATITLDYYAFVNENAVIADEGNPNVANFAYDTDPDFDPDNDPDDPKIPEEIPNEDYNPKEIPNPNYDPEGPDDDTNPEYIPNEEYDENKPETPSDPDDPNYEEPTKHNPDYPTDPDYPPYDPKDPTDDNYPEDPYVPEDKDGNPDPDAPFDPANPEVPYDEDNECETTTYVYALGILKVDQDGKALATAEFQVEKKVVTPAENEGEDDTVEYVPVYVTDKTGGVYEYDYSAAPTTGEDTRTNLVVSPENGQIVVKGLEAGEYRITETNAPKGYNILTTPVDMEIILEETYAAEITTYYDADGKVVGEENDNGETVVTPVAANVQVVPTTIQNISGTELPSTGGMGTTILYIIGGVLILGAAVLLITRKRMKSRD